MKHMVKSKRDLGIREVGEPKRPPKEIRRNKKRAEKQSYKQGKQNE